MTLLHSSNSVPTDPQFCTTSLFLKGNNSLPDDIRTDVTLDSRTFLISSGNIYRAVVPVGQLSHSHVMILPTNALNQALPCVENWSQILAKDTFTSSFFELREFVEEVLGRLRKIIPSDNSLMPIIFEDYRHRSYRFDPASAILHVMLVSNPEGLKNAVIDHYGYPWMFRLDSTLPPLYHLRTIGINSTNEYPEYAFLKTGENEAYLCTPPQKENPQYEAWRSKRFRNVVFEALKRNNEQHFSSDLWRVAASEPETSLASAIGMATMLRAAGPTRALG